MLPAITFDTNVLVYANDQRAEPAKRAFAQSLMQRAGLAGVAVLTLQALGEFVQASRKKALLPIEDVLERIANWREVFPLIEAEVDDLEPALHVVRRHGIQPWDALMIATAARHGIGWLLTEDMQDGAVLRGVTLLNPFNDANRMTLEEIGLS